MRVDDRVARLLAYRPLGAMTALSPALERPDAPSGNDLNAHAASLAGHLANNRRPEAIALALTLAYVDADRLIAKLRRSERYG